MCDNLTVMRFLDLDAAALVAERIEVSRMLQRFLPRRHRNKRRTPRLRLTITIVVERDGDGFYAYAPALKGLHVYDDTEEQVLEHAKEAIGVYLLSLAEHGDALPVGPDLAIQREAMQEVSTNAFTRNVMVSWPAARMSGIN